MLRNSFLLLTIFFVLGTLFSTAPVANETLSREEVLEQRMTYYARFADAFVPWYFLGAIDQYERNIQAVRSDIPNRDSVIAIQFDDETWAGALNPVSDDINPATISYFGGFGLDGDGDGIASSKDDIDVLFTMSQYVRQFGTTEEDFKLAVWEYYKDELVVQQILTISKLFQHFDTNNLDAHAFPIPKQHHYSYRGTWGANRGWGGRRIHEGTDIFAGYGTPIASTSYGIVENMGWNDFGGWRIGIRDNQNSYHYYAHLANFNEGVEVGKVVEPGEIIGFVGSSGYGKEGTSGKFPPHLHYGIYKFNGRTEWAFDPYPWLLNWEKQKNK